jgi:hypothetical protein
MFGVVSRNFVAARHPFQKRVPGCIQCTSFCHRNHFFVFRNEHAQSTTLFPKLMFWVVLRNFVAARHPFRKWVSGCIQCTNFCHRNHFFVFCNEHAQSTTLRPKLMFWVVSRNFVVARHPFRKRVSGCIKARVFATGTISSFFASNMPNTLLKVQNSCLGWFRAISLPHVTHSENGCQGVQKHEFLPPEPFLCFSQRICPILYFRSQTHVWGGFAQFRCRTSPIPKTGVAVHKSTSFCHRNHFFIFRNEYAQSTTLGPKLMFGVVSRNFVAARHPFRKRVSGCTKARVFATGTISLFFATNMPNPLL